MNQLTEMLRVLKWTCLVSIRDLLYGVMELSAKARLHAAEHYCRWGFVNIEEWGLLGNTFSERLIVKDGTTVRFFSLSKVVFSGMSFAHKFRCTDKFDQIKLHSPYGYEQFAKAVPNEFHLRIGSGDKRLKLQALSAEDRKYWMRSFEPIYSVFAHKLGETFAPPIPPCPPKISAGNKKHHDDTK